MAAEPDQSVGDAKPSAADASGSATTADKVASDGGHPAARSLAQLESSQLAMRDTTRWLVAAAAAVGAVIVTGIQLGNLPTGIAATAMSLAGFTIAMAGVAAVLFSAAAVLSAGYTTLGELSDLKTTAYGRELDLSDAWVARIEALSLRAEREDLSGLGWGLRQRRRLSRWSARALVPLYGLASRMRVRHEKTNGLRTRDLLYRINKDTSTFSNGLARDLAELSRRLRETDIEILEIRGETPAASKRATSAQGKDRKASNATADPLREIDQDKLQRAEWRLGRLELAAGQLIAFANQRVVERQFANLKGAVRLGGLAVVVGVGLFVVAPKLAVTRPLTVTQPTNVSVLVQNPKAFGSGCTKGTVLHGVAIGGTWEKPLVVTQPLGLCPASQLTLKPRSGIAIPSISSPSEVGTATPSPARP